MASIVQPRTDQARTVARRRPEHLRSGDYAVLVNANARGYARAVARGTFDNVPEKHLYLSRSLAQSEALIRELVDRRYKAIFTAGGDGTVAQLINELRAVVPNPADQPSIGVIRMGTGNAIADFAGASDPKQDLDRIASGASIERVRLQMVETEGVLAPFTGCGVDAAVLNDYIGLKAATKGTVFERGMSGVQGYLMAGVLKTAPQLLSPSRKRKVFVVNEGPVAYAVNRHGEVLDTYRRGAVIYSGGVDMACAGSVPFYGYRLKMLPSADRLPGFFQVRLAHMHPMLAVARLPMFWRGQVDRRHGVHDFLAQKVRFEFDGDVPFQIAGDAAGTRREFTARMDERTFDFIRPAANQTHPFGFVDEDHPREPAQLAMV